MVDPETALVAGAFVVALENLNRRFVDLQIPEVLGIGRQVIPENLQAIHRLGGPSVQGRGGDGHALAGKPLALAVQRQMIHIFIHQDGGQQAGAGDAFVNHSVRKGADTWRSAGRGVLVAYPPEQLHLSRNE